MRATKITPSSMVNGGLWVAQLLLAALFLFAGLAKLTMPLETLVAQSPPFLPGAFLRFIGVCEVLGALGLVLPGLTRVAPRLTPLAAAGLAIIMAGAVVTTIVIGAGAMAAMPGAAGVIAAAVAVGRWRVAPHAAGGRGPWRHLALATR